MSSTTRFIFRVVLRLLQLCCLYFVFLGIANIDPMITATKAWLNGDASVADVCWKILPVTAVILPTLGVFSIVQVLLGVITPTTHDPSEPWMANPMWADRHIRLNNKGTSWAVVLLIMVFWESLSHSVSPIRQLHSWCCAASSGLCFCCSPACFGSIVNGTLPSYEWLTCPE